jgi:hypothetical protein
MEKGIESAFLVILLLLPYLQKAVNIIQGPGSAPIFGKFSFICFAIAPNFFCSSSKFLLYTLSFSGSPIGLMTLTGLGVRVGALPCGTYFFGPGMGWGLDL